MANDPLWVLQRRLQLEGDKTITCKDIFITEGGMEKLTSGKHILVPDGEDFIRIMTAEDKIAIIDRGETNGNN
jgi:hypothetical protein